MTNKIDRYFASLYLASIGDRIGFGNGDREFNLPHGIIDSSNKDWELIVQSINSMMIFEFITQGGVIGLIEKYSDRDELYNNIVKNYLKTASDTNYFVNILKAGRQTIEALKDIKSGMNWRQFSYKKSAGGNGGAMRTMCIGLAFNKSSNLLALIESSIMISSITHPNCISFIGSIASALFTSYAINDIEPEKWIFEFIRLLESEQIDNIIEKMKPSYIELFKEDKKTYLNKLLTYVEQSFDDNYNYIINEKHLRHILPNKRILYYYEEFATNKKIIYPGAGADDCIIIAYDCLLMSKDNYEKLIYTSMIHIGDSDTTGSIASAWFGALYGFKNVSPNLTKENELYQTIHKYAIALNKKYFN